MYETLLLALGLTIAIVLMVAFRVFAGWKVWKLWKTCTSKTGEPNPDIDPEKARAEN